MLQVFAAISVILTVAAAPPYIIDTIKGKTRPERATWFILSVLGLIGFLSQLAIEVNWSLVFLGVDTLATLIVLCLSFKYGVGGWTLLDRYALLTAAAGVAIALIASQPLAAIGGNILADFAGTFLTIRKAYLQPGTETSISWILVGVAATFGALDVGKLDYKLLIWP